MKWLNKILNRSDDSRVYSNFQSLKKIESLPPSQRSSSVYQAKKDLLALNKDDAINWLEKNISSPVGRDWGILLFKLSADWDCLKSWINTSKLHALAAADAINCYVDTLEKLPVGSTPSEVISELQKLLSEYDNLRLKGILENVSSFLNPPPLPKKVREASEILFGKSDLNIVIREKDLFSKWESLFHKANNKYCLTILDWKCEKSDLEVALSALPIVRNLEANQLSDLEFETIDVGSDQTILIALPHIKMNRLKELAPSSIKFNPTTLRPTSYSSQTPKDVQ